ncbi:hypothetical protein BJ875DRAFT_463321 [Amylocarpus encephaloides]|uniref:Uncharacterized protein n=1 Tax=Amylocarpus encephaloides TaxID=45428 RepID=A0A9P7YHT4_9HELO|nr:hypothetical protein BJ875DRAFT_463321 [Amylocarpus encephaloides]
MAFSRVAAMRFCFRAARPSIARPQLYQQVARRTYASGGHETAKAGGDALWAAGAVAVTVPTCWFILSQSPDESHGHNDSGAHGKGHGEHEEESKDSEEPESEESEAKEESKDAEDSDDSDSSEKGQGTPDTSDDEGGQAREKVLAKDDDTNNTRKHVPDAKGGVKLRIESEKGQKAGEVGGQGATSGKHSGAQEGLSNTDTKHSTDITNDPSTSKKGEGVPETAKSKGPVDPKRPQPEKE